MLTLCPVPRCLLSTFALFALVACLGCSRSADGPPLNEMKQEALENEEADIAESATESEEAETTKEDVAAAEKTIKKAEAEEDSEEVSKRVKEIAKEEPTAVETVGTPIRPTEEQKAKTEQP